VADTLTTHYDLIKIGIGERRDSWGTVSNDNLDRIDAALKAIADAVAVNVTAIATVQTAASNAQTTANQALELAGSIQQSQGVAIVPYSAVSSGTTPTHSASFTASASDEVAASYKWGASSGNGWVSAGVADATATLMVYAAPGETQDADFYCDLEVAGKTYRAICSMTYTNTTPAA
jgi:hypothetical protein